MLDALTVDYSEMPQPTRRVGLWALIRKQKYAFSCEVPINARIIRAANRYARRFGNIRTVGQWNALVERIGEGFHHYKYHDLRDIRLNGMDNSPLVRWHPDKSDWCMPDCRFTKWQVLKRHRSLLIHREYELERRQPEIHAQLRADIAEAKRDIAAIRKAIKETSAALSRTSP